MSTIITIADAVVSSLNAGTFAVPFEAQRKYQPVFELKDMQTLHVSVVPKSVTITGATRSSGFFDYAIDVGIQKKVNPEEPTELDELTALVEAIADHLRLKRLDDAPDAAWVSIANEPIFAPDHLEKQRTFTSILTVTYRVRR